MYQCEGNDNNQRAGETCISEHLQVNAWKNKVGVSFFLSEVNSSISSFESFGVCVHQIWENLSTFQLYKKVGKLLKVTRSTQLSWKRFIITQK